MEAKKHINGTAMNGHTSNGIMLEKDKYMPVAIIGMACRFPGDATSPNSFWDMLATKRDVWREVPKDRFNIDAFYHPDPDRNGSFNSRGGYFLQQDISAFDAPFFAISPAEAKSMDPQQRILLETVYDAMEAAGITLKNLAGSETSCYVATVSRDYYDILGKDPETFPVYQSTGNGASIISNRVSHFYDLKGPSLTLDSACSSSLVAIHLACQSLQNGESKMAIVGATNLVLGPDLNIGLSNLHFLSPDAKCYSFDSRGNGYVRGEGICAVILKPLEQALADNDIIRAVIRGTACNQDGRTPGITLPSQLAQESLIAKAYQVSGCDPAITGYFEAHGTGTKVGDPIETAAIGATMGPHRPPGERGDLYIGSVKPNIGHLEAASGLAGLIKTVMSLEKGLIVPNALYDKPNERIDFEGWRIKVPTTLLQWPFEGLRRASVNSFGYGGTNAHVILDDALHYLQSRGLQGFHNTSSKPLLQENPKSAGTGIVASLQNNHHHDSLDRRYRAFIWTGHESGAVKTLCTSYAAFCSSIEPQDTEVFLDSLAYTLSERRSQLPWSALVVASSKDDLADQLKNKNLEPLRKSNEPVKIGYVFTGQGAQWWAMGRELISIYDTFRNSLLESDLAIKGLGATWSLMDELMRQQEHSRISEPSISQTVCTAVQIAIVDLLKDWNVTSRHVIGHSSGEIAAAYTAGVLCRRSAMQIAYFRGVYSAKVNQYVPGGGAMLAAGISEKEAINRIQVLDQTRDRVAVACVNSPKNVTLSGDPLAIDQLEQSINEDGIFVRRLRVKTAYHSHHMVHIADDYLSSISGTSGKGEKCGQPPEFTSTVTGALMSSEDIFPEYWIKNLLSCVRFNEGLQSLLKYQTAKRNIRKNLQPAVDVLLEIGPHSALAGPIREIIGDLGFEKGAVAYFPTLVRDRNASQTMLEVAAGLSGKGYPIDLRRANFPNAQGRSHEQLMIGLPSYPWNRDRKYWSESRLSSTHRFRQYARHNLLGAPVPDWNPVDPRWRNFIRISEQPWIKQHQVQGVIIYPAAGYICAAVEAAAQMASHPQGTKISSFQLREVVVARAIIVPQDDEGIEVALSLRPFRTGSTTGSTSDMWKEFIVSSWSMGEWTENCRGLISTVFKGSPNEVVEQRENELLSQKWELEWETASRHCSVKTDPDELFEKCARNGNSYGPVFRNFVDLAVGPNQALSFIQIPHVTDTLPQGYEQDHVIHPVTLDAVMQMLFPTFSGRQEAFVPTWIDEIDISPEVLNKAGEIFRCYSSAVRAGVRDVILDITSLKRDSPTPLVTIKGMKCVALSETSNFPTQALQVKKHCFDIVWEADIELLTKDQADSMLKTCYVEEVSSDLIAKFELVSYYFFHQLLETISQDDVRSLLPHHQKFMEYMQHQHQNVMDGKSRHQNAEWLDVGKPEAAAKMECLVSVIEQTGYEGELLCRIGRRLKSIMTQEIHPLTLMLEGGLLHKYYAEGIGHKTLHAQYSKYFTLLSHKYPNLDYLEIGGGTAGSTLPILNVLGGDDGKYPRFKSYTFTDISSGFFENAGEKLKSWGDLIQYRKLDIEGDLQSQGFQGQKFDVIIAANVLHATKSINRTLTNVRSLLKPGGKLILLEITNSLLRINLMFGILPGWWLSEESERQWGPTLTVDGWEAAFKRNGFTGIVSTGPDFPNERDYLCRVMVTESTEESASLDLLQQGSSGALLVVAKSQSEESLNFCNDIRQGLESREIPYLMKTLENLQDADCLGRVCISLAELQTPLLKDIQPSEFESLKNIVTKTDGLLWISQGAGQTTSRPELALVHGLARVVRTENAAYPFVTFDVGSYRHETSSIVRDTLLNVFESTCVNGRWSEQEYSERDGVTSIKRCIENADLNLEIAQMAQGLEAPSTLQPLYQPDCHLKLDDRSLNNFQFINDLEIREDLPSDYVEIEVHAVGVNIRDIMVSLGQINEYDQGCECSGTVVRTGSAVKNIQVGDRVAAWVFGAYYSTFARAPATSFQHLPDEIFFEMGASLPVAFCTAYYGLVSIAKVRRGESVLIHAAAGAVGQAAIMLCQHYRAEVFITVGSKAKKTHLMDIYGIPEDHIFSSRDTTFVNGIIRMTQARGVDIVLNSLSGETLKQTWRCIAPFGRFIELGKKDIYDHTRLDMFPFIRNVIFASVNLVAVYKHMPQLGAEIFSNVIRLIQQKVMRQVTPLKIFSFSQIEESFRFMQSGKHMGKIVLVPNQRDVVPVVSGPQRRLLFSSDASYLLVGGLGGLGRSIARWMGANGAKHIIVVSRSGVVSRPAIELVEELAGRGVQVHGLKCDVADEQSLKKNLDSALISMPEIHGVVYAAMILEDQVFESMQCESFKKVVRPKVHGTWNVHQATRSQPVEFFIMLSSLSGIIGNASQANYAAGNAFQDAMAYYRRSIGLPAISLNLGMINSVGWVAENQEIAARNLKRWGYLAIEEPELIALLETAMKRDIDSVRGEHPAPLSSRSCQVVTGAGSIDIFDPDELPPYFNSPTFSHLKQTRDRTKLNASTLAEESLSQLLERKDSSTDAAGIILDALLNKLSKLLMIPVENLDAYRPTVSYGIDSLIAVEIRNWFIKEAKADIPVMVILQSTSLQELSRKATDKSRLVKKDK